MLGFDKIVNKMLKKGGNLFLKEDIFEMIDPERKKEYANYVNKIIYRLKAEGIIISLKAGVYIVPDETDARLNKVDLIEKYYFKLLKRYITFYIGSHYFLSGRKALELHMKNFEVPEKVFIVNRDINKKFLVGENEIIFKTVSGKIEGKKQNIYSKLSCYTEGKGIEGVEFKISSLELALVEAALVNDTELGVPVELITKAMKKYSGVFNKEVFYEIGRYKFTMSFNRLKELSKNIAPELYVIFLDIIKKNGGLFIGEGLRGI